MNDCLSICLSQAAACGRQTDRQLWSQSIYGAGIVSRGTNTAIVIANDTEITLVIGEYRPCSFAIDDRCTCVLVVGQTSNVCFTAWHNTVHMTTNTITIFNHPSSLQLPQTWLGPPKFGGNYCRRYFTGWMPCRSTNNVKALKGVRVLLPTTEYLPMKCILDWSSATSSSGKTVTYFYVALWCQHPGTWIVAIWQNRFQNKSRSGTVCNEYWR